MTSIPDCSDDFAKYATAQKPKEYLFQTCQDWFSYKQEHIYDYSFDKVT